MGRKSKKEKRASHYKQRIIEHGRKVTAQDGKVYAECPRTGTLVRVE